MHNLRPTSSPAQTRTSLVLSAGLIALFVLLTFFINRLFNTLTNVPNPFLLLYLAVIVGGCVGGLWGGFLAVSFSTLLSYLAGEFGAGESTAFMAFVLEGMLISVFTAWVVRRISTVPNSGDASLPDGLMELHEQRRFTQTLLNTMPSVLYLLDVVQQRNLFINSYAITALGYSPEEIIQAGAAFMPSVMHPDDLVRFPAHFQALVESQPDESLAFEYRMKHKDGTWRWFLAQDVVFERDRDGSLRQILGIAQDVTARKQAEESQEKSTALLRTFVESTPDLVWAKDIQGRITLGNHATFQLLGGGKPDRVLGFGAVELVPDPTHAQRIMENDAQVITTEQPALVEEYFGTPGQVNVFQTVKAPLRDSGGAVVGIVGISRNITEQRQMESDLRESEARFRNMANNAPVMVWMTEPDGTCTFLSESWYDFTGQTPETGLGFGWLKAAHPDDQASAEQVFRKATAKHEEFRLDYRLRRKDGVYRWAIDSARPRLGEHGEFLGYIGSVIDITDRKQAEEALRESEEKYRTLFDSIDEGFCICELLVDENGRPRDYRFLEANQMFEPHTGLKDVVGKTALELLPDLEQDWIDTYGNVALTGEPVRFTQGSDVMGRWFDVFSFRLGPPEKRQFAVLFTDITARKQADARLRERQQRLAIATSAAKLGIFEWNVNDDAAHWENERMYEIFGHTPADGPVSKQDFIDRYLFAEDRATLEQLSWETAQSSNQLYVVFRMFRRGDAALRWIECTGHFEMDKAGRPIRLVGVVADVTERKQAEVSLFESAERLRIAKNAAGLGIFDYNVVTGRIEFDDRVREIGGVDAQDKNIIDALLAVIHPEDRALATAALHTALDPASSGEHHAVYRVIHRHNSVVRWVAAAGRTFVENGRVVRITGTIQDITETKRSEMRSRQLQALTRALSNAVTLGDVLDTISNQGFAALGAERGGIALVAEDKMTVRFVAYAHPELPVDLLEQLQAFPLNTPSPMTDAIRSRQPVWITNLAQYRAQYPNYVEGVQGLTQSQALFCLPMTNQDQMLGGIGVSFKEPQVFSSADQSFALSIAEVCAQALVRAQLYETEKTARREAEEANRLKTQFVGMISHELRTPLTSIKGFVSTLLAEDVAWSAEQQRQFLMITEGETDKLTELVEQLLNLARLQSGSLPIDPIECSVAAIVDLATIQFETLTLEHRLQVEGVENVPLVVADPQRIAQVLVNLVGNAVKFSPSQSVITVNAQRQGSYVQLDVSDQGVGIPHEARDYIFEAFRQVNLAEHNRGKGAGLGLAICKGLVEAHHGRIWVQDRPGVGTTISFTLPIALTTG